MQMLNLILIRHAQAVPGSMTLPDSLRPLTQRGEIEASFMGALLHLSGRSPDLIVSSQAVRAVTTARLLAGSATDNPEPIRIESRIYLQPVSTLLQVIQSLDDSLKRIYLVGHNPDITDLVDFLTSELPFELPTAAVASISFELDSWGYVEAGSGSLDFCVHPGMYRLPR